MEKEAKKAINWLLLDAYHKIRTVAPGCVSALELVSKALAAWQAFERLGSPEGDLAIAALVIYLATAPKSNAAYQAFTAAGTAVAETGSLPPPAAILNAPTGLMKQLGYGAGYTYDHDSPDGFSGQNCFPDAMGRHQFYQPVERGYEREIGKRLAYWSRLRAKKQRTGTAGGEEA